MSDIKYNPIEAVAFFSKDAWQKSTFTNKDDDCVEFALGADGRVGLRDSKQPAAAALLFDPGEVSAFIKGVKNGEFDHFLS